MEFAVRVRARHAPSGRLMVFRGGLISSMPQDDAIVQRHPQFGGRRSTVPVRTYVFERGE
jgi:hypothetical protein